MKKAFITIKRGEEGTESINAFVIEEGTTHVKCCVPDKNSTRHHVDLIGEWFPYKSKCVNTKVYA